jgi:hypothetical protein
MNMIALTNMIMASILAVLIALKMLQTMNVIMTTLTCIACPSGQPECAYCSAGDDFEPKVQAAIEKQEKVAAKLLPLLSRLQRVVAWTTAYVALSKSKEIAEHYTPSVTGGVVLSPSMVPCEPGGCAGKLGLPVQEAEFGKLCDKTSAHVAEIAFFWMTGNRLKTLKEGLLKYAGSLTDGLPSALCGGAGAAGTSADIKELARQACIGIKKREQEKYEEEHGDSDGFDFDLKKCQQTKQRQLKAKLGGATGGELSIDEISHKQIYEDAELGGFYFQVYGFANADASWPRRNDKGITIASQAGGMSVPNGLFNAMRFAQAEFYFDRAGSWQDNADQALWELAWRARLRRARAMPPDLTASTFAQARGKLPDLIDPKIAQQLLDGEFFEFLTGQGGFDDAAEWLQGQHQGAELDDGRGKKQWEVVH